jgi:Mu transposase, C-terminal
MFGEWVATYWQKRVHRGLELPPAPRLDLTPNEAFVEGLNRGGLMYIVPNDTLYFDCLPTKWVTINMDGVSLDKLTYDHFGLNDFRRVRSPYGGKDAGKYPIRYDPRDLVVVYFYDFRPDKQQWLALRWRGARETQLPFTDVALGYAKALVIARLQRLPTATEVEESLKQLLNRWEKLQTLNERERRMLVRNAAKTMDAARERAKAEPHLILPDEDVGFGFNDVALESAISGVSSEEVQVLANAFESFDQYDRESDTD